MGLALGQKMDVRRTNRELRSGRGLDEKLGAVPFMPRPQHSTSVRRLPQVDNATQLRAVGSQDPQRVWQATLDELQLQMTAHTFNRWLKHTRALELTDGTLRVAVHNHYVKEWLDNRLRSTIDRTLAYVAGELAVEFVVAPLALTASRPAFPPRPRPQR